MWVFHHIPKTAGSAIVRAWEESLTPPRCANVFVSEEELKIRPDYDSIFDEKFRQFQERIAHENVPFACGHFTHDQIDWLMASGAKLFVFLRHPIDRLISDYKYQLHPPSFAPEEFARRYPSFEHFIRNQEVHNTMCRFIVGDPNVGKAFERLTSYAFAGTTENLSDTNQLIMIRAGVAPQPLARVNTSLEVSKRRMGDKARYLPILERLEAEDLTLYERISARMKDAVASLRS